MNKDIRGYPWSPCDHCPRADRNHCPSRRHRNLCELARNSEQARNRIIGMDPETIPGPEKPRGLAPQQPERVPSRSQILICHTSPKGHHGVGVNGVHTMKSLAHAGISGDIIRSIGYDDISSAIGPNTRNVIIQGAVLPSADMTQLARNFPTVRFTVRCHNQIAFLWIEPPTFQRFKEIAEAGLSNLGIGAVSRRFADWFKMFYMLDCEYLPNLYHFGTHEKISEPDWGTIHVGIFGAHRPQKHHSVSIAASIALSRLLKIKVDIHINRGRDVSIENKFFELFRAMASKGSAELVFHDWSDNETFLDICRRMDIGYALSSTETFNIVTADLASLRIPSVVGECIDWMPTDMKSPIDDPVKAAEIGAELLADPRAGDRAFEALEAHQQRAVEAWQRFLGLNPHKAPQGPTRPRNLCRHFAPVFGKDAIEGHCGALGKIVCRLADCPRCDLYEPST